MSLPIKPPPGLVRFTPSTSRLGAGRNRPRRVQVTLRDLEAVKEEEKDRSKYKIEVWYSSHRSSLPHKPSPLMVLIWESGSQLHGGGDQKLYWCGYKDCEKPIFSDDFISHGFVVCRICNRENFRSEPDRTRHVRMLRNERRSSEGLDRLATLEGERMMNVTPPVLAKFLEKVFWDLRGEADLYLKYSRDDIVYDILHETTADLNNLDKVRLDREPVIYTLKAIRQDIAHGSDLRGRFLAMITA